MANPTQAEKAVSAIPNMTITTTIPIAASSPLWNENPMTNAAPTRRRDWSPSRRLSESVRPTRNAERAMGNDRNRSIIPDCRS